MWEGAVLVLYVDHSVWVVEGQVCPAPNNKQERADTVWCGLRLLESRYLIPLVIGMGVVGMLCSRRAVELSLILILNAVI